MNINKLSLYIFSIIAILLVSCQENKQETTINENNPNLIVLVQYKTQPAKSDEAVDGLTKLIQEVKKEPNFVGITMHIDPKDNSNILLYEEWRDETYYNGDHMKTEHLQNFINDSRNFLAGPPVISQWKIEKEFSSK